MRHQATRRLRLVCVAALLVWPVACSPSRGCTLIGATNAVTVGFDNVMNPSAARIYLTACVNGHCQSQLFNGVQDSALVVEFPSIPGDATVHVSVRVRKAGRTVFVGSTM